MPDKHALLSASSSHRWLNCPPSARLCENYDDKGSDFAAEGTDAHTLCEYKLKKALGIPAKNPTDNLSWYSAEMEDCANGYAAFVTELVEDAKKSCPDPVVLIEQRLDYSKYVAEGFGTGDCVIIADGTLHIVDYKHGRGVLVEADENPQMKLYALGALELFDCIYDISTVSMTTYQPRRSNVSTFTVPKEELYNWADNATVTVSLNATVYEASYSNSLAIKNGGTTILTVTGLSWSKGTANRTVTLTSAQRTALLNAMATVKSFTGTFALSSFSGSAQIGSISSRTATVQTTAANSAPTLGGFIYEDSNTATKNITEDNRLFIQNHSVLKVTPGTATAKNGATITNYTASCNGLSVSNSTGAALSVGKITKSGNVMVTLTITDSRGYTSGVSKAVIVIPYSKPKVSSITLRRTNDIEAEMQLIFSGSISAVLVNGVQKNSVVYVRYRYEKTNESSYGAFTSILGGTTRSGTSFSYSNLELCNLDANSSYDFHLQVQDKLYSASSLDLYFTVPQGTPLIALRKKKVGINTPNPQATLDVAGSVRVNNSALADFVVQHGTNGIWTFRKWKSGIAECWCRKTVSATLNNNWGPLYTSGSLTALNIAFPFTFSAVPTITANLSCNGVGAFLMVPGSSPGPSTKSTGVYEIGRATSLSSANIFEVNFYVIGKV